MSSLIARAVAPCCFGQGQRYLPVDGGDDQRLGEAAERVTQFVGNRCYMRLLDGHCIAPDVGNARGLSPSGHLTESHLTESHLTESQPHRYACTLYPVRPKPCRSLERGSPGCLAVLEAAPSVTKGPFRADWR